ncbi:hypothetical protein WMY93_001919 [Mugilogobius chulae]|uniref:C2H2-type domain-containing protein n=1 Tax=Mugilogobius chulae TaxID=88201 RepID=A0AAW0PTC0_9GOBI
MWGGQSGLKRMTLDNLGWKAWFAQNFSKPPSLLKDKQEGGPSSVTSVGRRDAMLQASKQLTPEKDDSAVASEGQDLQSLESLNDKSFDTGEKTFSCDQCGKTWPDASALKRHYKTSHTRVSCDVCKKTFSTSRYLVTHMRIHTGEKPYSCEVCEKAFYHQGHVAKHMRIHTGEKPYSCDVCTGPLTPASWGCFSFPSPTTATRQSKLRSEVIRSALSRSSALFRWCLAERYWVISWQCVYGDRRSAPRGSGRRPAPRAPDKQAEGKKGRL